MLPLNRPPVTEPAESQVPDGCHSTLDRPVSPHSVPIPVRIEKLDDSLD